MSRDTLKTGIELIAEERYEQIHKHKWDDTNAEYLVELAKYLLFYNYLDYAEKDNIREYLKDEYDIPQSVFDKFDSKTEIERLTVSAALLAAQIDRLPKYKI